MSRPIETPPVPPATAPAAGNIADMAAASANGEKTAPDTAPAAPAASPESSNASPAPEASASVSEPREASATPPAADKVDRAKLEQLIIDALHTVYDPEIPVDIYELGLIYSIEIDDNAKVAITMTLTTPACPVAGSMPGQVEKVVRMIEGVSDVVVDLVWEPTWGPAMMTESARLQLNMY